MSPEVTTNVVFGAITVVLGVLGVLIVKWSTDLLASRRQENPAATQIQSIGTNSGFDVDLELLPLQVRLTNNEISDSPSTSTFAVGEPRYELEG